MSELLECGSCEYETDQGDKLQSHYMTKHTLSNFDARRLVIVSRQVAALPSQQSETTS